MHLATRLFAGVWTVVLVHAAGAQTPGPEEAETQERSAVVQLARSAFAKGDFVELERQAALYILPSQRTQSGAFKIQLFDDGIAAALRGPANADELHHLASIALTKTWISEYPKAPQAVVLHAQALSALAQYYRGSGYSNAVPPLAWAKFEEFNRQAGKVLTDAESYASLDTSWHATLINVARNLGWPRDVVLRIAADGIKRNPDDFRVYRNTVEYLLPRWYGDAYQLDTFIRVAERSTTERHGSEIYARLYSALAQVEYQHRLYKDSRVEWSKMKRGLEDWTSHFPTPWNYNIYAYHACIAEDKDTTKLLLAKIQDAPMMQMWNPNGRVTYSTCKSWVDEP